jgi:hypothetical protein
MTEDQIVAGTIAERDAGTIPPPIVDGDEWA